MLSQFFKEDNGNLSATRLTMILWAFGIFAIWAYVSCHKKEISEIPASVITIMGIMVSGKAVQKFGEKPCE